jgi:hypothetical protein
MVGLHESLDRRLPVAVEDDPLAPLVAHLLELEGVEDRCGGFEILAQGRGVRIHVDENPAAPRVHRHSLEARTLVRERTLPVGFVELERALAVQIVPPAVEAADEQLSAATCAVTTGRRIHQTSAAVGAHVVIGLNRIGRSAHHDDRVIADVVREKVADIRDFLDAPGVLPHSRP